MDGAADSGHGRAPVFDGRPHRPELLVIGATSRNSGKTELACRLIKRHAASIPVVGLKVTTVERTDGRCPHGGAGCGICSSLTQPWILSRELDRESPKDTCRMLASGARRVYWLRALRSDLAGGVADLLTRIPSGWVAVCESTSLREVVEPGLFLLVRAAGSVRAKPTARAVAHLAEQVVVSHGRSFEFDLDRISVVDRQWALRREACAVVIDDAGGGDAVRRTRESLEPQFDRVVVGPGTAASPDPEEAWCLVTPPVASGIPPGLVNAMFRRRAEVDVVVAVTRSEGRDVCLALCRRGLLPEVIASIGRGPGAVASLDDRCAVRELRLGAAGTGVGIGRLPATAQRTPAWRPANRRGTNAP